MTKVKQLDCVAMKRRASLLLHEKLSKMSYDERIAYWKMRADEMIAERESWKNDEPPADAKPKDNG